MSYTFTPEVVLLQPVAVSVNVNVTLPAAIPVTTPPLVTDAFVSSLLTHVPPETGDKVIVLPTHTEEAVLTTGNALTITVEVELLQPVAVSVNVNVTLPAATPVTTPPFVTVAFKSSLLTHVPPVVGDKVIVLPKHTDEAAFTAGVGFTVIVKFC